MQTVLQQQLLAVARTGEAVCGLQHAYGQRYIVDFERADGRGHCTAFYASTHVAIGLSLPQVP